MNIYIKLFWLFFNAWTMWWMSGDERIAIALSSVIVIMTSNMPRQLQYLNSMIIYRYMNEMYVSPILYMLVVFDILTIKYSAFNIFHTLLISTAVNKLLY
jgi:hypothetical protein